MANEKYRGCFDQCDPPYVPPVDKAVPTDQQKFLLMASAIASAVKEAGQIPSGHLYAAVMGRIGLPLYNRIIEMLIRERLIRREPSHLLIWIGD